MSAGDFDTLISSLPSPVRSIFGGAFVKQVTSGPIFGQSCPATRALPAGTATDCTRWLQKAAAKTAASNPMLRFNQLTIAPELAHECLQQTARACSGSRRVPPPACPGLSTPVERGRERCG
jgi:hypothetical protein